MTLLQFKCLSFLVCKPIQLETNKQANKQTKKMNFQNEHPWEFAQSLGHKTVIHFLGFPGDTSGKEPACQCRRWTRCRFHLLHWEDAWSRKQQFIPVFLPGESHGQKSLTGHILWGHRVRHNWRDLAQHSTRHMYGLNVCKTSKFTWLLRFQPISGNEDMLEVKDTANSP